jgi:hypothetical protein
MWKFGVKKCCILIFYTSIRNWSSFRFCELTLFSVTDDIVMIMGLFEGISQCTTFHMLLIFDFHSFTHNNKCVRKR